MPVRAKRRHAAAQGLEKRAVVADVVRIAAQQNQEIAVVDERAVLRAAVPDRRKLRQMRPKRPLHRAGVRHGTFRAQQAEAVHLIFARKQAGKLQAPLKILRVIAVRQRAQDDLPHHAAALRDRLIRRSLPLLLLARRDRLADGRRQKLRPHRLFDVVDGAERNSRLQIRLVRIAADKDDLALGIPRVDLGAHFDAAHAAHPDVRKHDVRPQPLAQGERLLRAFGALHHADSELFPIHMPRKAVADRPLVVYDQQFNHRNTLLCPFAPQPCCLRARMGSPQQTGIAGLHHLR